MTGSCNDVRDKEGGTDTPRWGDDDNNDVAPRQRRLVLLVVVGGKERLRTLGLLSLPLPRRRYDVTVPRASGGKAGFRGGSSPAKRDDEDGVVSRCRNDEDCVGCKNRDVGDTACTHRVGTGGFRCCRTASIRACSAACHCALRAACRCRTLTVVVWCKTDRRGRCCRRGLLAYE